MVRETRHLWVGNLPDNIREDRIREHFKRYGRVQSVKLLPRCTEEKTGEITMACTVAFMDIKSASKAHNAELKIDDRTLNTEYYEPAAIPSAASPQNTPSPYSTSPGTTRFPNGHGSSDEHGTFPERFYDRSTPRVASEGEFIRRTGYHDTSRGRNRDRSYRNGPYNSLMDRHTRTLNNSWTYDTTRYNNTAGCNQTDTGYSATPSENSERRNSDQSSKKKTKSRSGSRSPSPSGSTSSRSPSRSRSRSSSSSSSSSTSRDTSSTGSPKSRRLASSASANHQPVVHSDDRRPLAICVKNLPLRSSDTSLKDGLFHEYKKHGKVTWVKVVGQNSERHAIVCFKKPEDVEKALEVSYDKSFFGCKIEVVPYQGYDVEDNDLRPYEAEIDEFHPKATRTLFIGNLEKDVTASDLRKHFDPFGEIIEIDIKKQGAVSSYAFCQYSDIMSVVKAIRKMDGEHLGNNRIKLGFGKSMPYNCVWIDGVNENVNEKYLRMQFEPFGVLGKVHIDREKGQALIFYEQVLNAQTAVNKMRGFSLKNTKIQVDFASRECQESFFERLEKQGTVLDRTPFEERRDSNSRSFEASSVARFSRYDTPTRPRTSSYSSRSSAAASQVTSSMQSPGTPGSVTPRGSGSRTRVARFAEYYDQTVDYPDRHSRNCDEYSQGSAASHEDAYEHEYTFVQDSPTHVTDPLDTRSLQNVVDTVVPFAPPDIRNLQKERVHLLEQLEECPSSGDELMSPKKRLKLELLDSTSDVIIEANRDHRKVMEVRRLSDVNLKHHSRRPSIDSAKHSTRDTGHDRSGYLPHAVCKRRKTAGSDSGSRVHHYDHSGSESVGGSRPGTPLVDEKPENFQHSEPRRVPREREGPLTLPLPRFAAQVMNRGSVSVAGIKGQKDNTLSSPPSAVTSPRISNPRPPSPVHVPPPASPPPRPPSLSSNSSDSDITPPSPSLEERIKSLDEKYEKWSGSRGLSAAGGDALAMLDANLEKFRLRHKLLDLDLKEVQPSEIVKSVMAKRSVFDEDLKRLENVGEKYEPKEFSLFPRATTTTAQTSVPVTPLSAPPTLKLAPVTQLPKTPTMLSPRSAGSGVPTAKGLQYPFPTHPPVLMSPVPSHPQTPTTPTTSTPLLAPTATSTTTTTTRGTSHGENRLKPCANVSGDVRTSSKVNVNRSTVVSSLAPIKISEKTNTNIPNTGDISATPSASLTSEKHNKTVREVKSSDKTSEKISYRRDSNSSSPRADIKTRRNSDTSARRIEDSDKFSDADNSNKERAKSEESKRERLEKARLENERLEREKIEKERIEKERLEKERQEKERLEKERLEIERLERESELEKQRLEKERIEKEKQEKERAEKEKARVEKERAEKARQEMERAEKDRLERERIEKENLERERQEQERLEKEKKERERKEREERERKEREERERREREEQQEKERLEKLEKEKKERERKEREERERKEREDRERKEREERERKDREEKERREEEERLEKEKLERERLEKEKLERERKREEERARHKEDNHDKRKDDHKHRENHSETKHRENSLDKHLSDNKNTKETSKEEKSRDSHELFRRDSHDARSSHEKTRHHTERDAERRKESIKENRDNNVHDKHKTINNTKDISNRTVIESRHMSIDLDKTRTYDNIKPDPNKRKERNNSVPAIIGSKRRLSSHESLDNTDESKKIKLSHDHKKLSERRDSKDSIRSEDRSKSKHKNNVIKSHDKHNSLKEFDEKRKDREKEREERHKKHKLEKQKSKSKSREKESRESPTTPKSPVTDKDFLARLDLKSNEEIEKQRKDSKECKENREKRKEIASGCTQEDKDTKEKPFADDRLKKEKPPVEKQQSTDKVTKIRTDADPKSEERKRRDRVRKITNSSDSDSDEPKKHSIFDIVDDEPAYISMYDKVKARSCKNMAKQEEEKRQEKIKAKFSQLKQSRAKREEKKRSTSWDEDSDSDKDTSETKTRRSKMLIDSSDDENHERKSRKKKEMYSDSDSSTILRHIKQEHMETSEDEVRNKITVFKPSKSRIMSDTSEDEYNKRKLHVKIKTEMLSDPENTSVQGFVETEEKLPPLTKVKDELERLIKKERRNSKHQDSLTETKTQIFRDSGSPLSEPKTEKFNNRHSFPEITSDEESTGIKKERSERREKKHKKKQKKQKHSVSEDSSKFETTDSTQIDTPEKYKHHEKKKEHSKKEKRRDKTREKSKKSKKNKSESKSEAKREGKMENIFGSLSEDSENGVKDLERQEKNSNMFLNKINEETLQQQSAYNSESEKEQDNKAKEKEEREREREEHKKRKEKKRREKERRLQEAAAAAAAAVIEQTSNDNSMDYADMGKQLEENMMKDESLDVSEEMTKSEVDSSNLDNPEDPFRFVDVAGVHEIKREKEERKEGKEKKKKRKKSKDERSKHHHHHHHHDKNKVRSPEFKKEPSPVQEIKVEIEESKPQNQSLPTILDEHNSSPNKPVTPDFSISPMKQETNPIISPIPKTPTTSKEKKRDKFIPGFGVAIDEKIHESAVKSISEFETAIKKEEIVSDAESKTDKLSQITEEKPRVVISQEETEDAVAALLGESFGDGQFEECYNDEINSTSDQTTTLVEESNVQDDEEMRQAVQSLSATDLDVKPDTPQSEHELQIDTDTEEQEEISLRFDSKTPDISDFSQVPKTPDITNYFRNTADDKASTSLILKTTPTPIGSPPSLTPIKSQPAAVAEIRKSLDLEQKSLPVLQEQQQRSVISQSWSTEKQSDIIVSKTEPKSETVVPPSISDTTSQQSQAKTNTTSTLRQYTAPPMVKLTDSVGYPPLTAIIKPDHVKISVADQPSKVQTMPLLQTSSKSSNTSQLHNLPARSPVQMNKPSTSMHDSALLSPKSSSSLIHNRLPITPMMVSKPLQPTTVILQQSKVAHSIEPPKLVPTSDHRPQERSRMIFQTSTVQPPQFSNFVPNQPRMMLQGNVRHLPPQGLLVPTRQLPPNSYQGYLGNISHSSYNLSPIVKENSPAGLTEKNHNENAQKTTTSVPSGLSVISGQSSSVQPVIIPSTSTQSHLSMQQPVTISSEQSPKSTTAVLVSPKMTTSAPSPKPFLPISVSPKPSPVPPSSASPKPVIPVSSPKPVMPVSSPKPVMPVSSPKPVIPVSSPKPVIPVSSPKPVIPVSSPKPVIATTSPKLTAPVSSPGPMATSSISPVPEIHQKTSENVDVEQRLSSSQNIDFDRLDVKTEISTPSPVIVPTSKEVTVQEPKQTPKTDVKLEESSTKLAIEKVTDELNMSLEKESPEVKEDKAKLEEIPNLKQESLDKNIESKPKIEEIKNNPVVEELPAEPENVSVIKEIEKFDEEKADTESIVSDISKERSSADILAKDDPLDTKEDSDYWSAKEVNIDSVIKTLCSADELSDHSSENGKDEWFDDNKANDSTKSESREKEPSMHKTKMEVSVTESCKNEESEAHDEGLEPEEDQKEALTLRSGVRNRNGRGRGRGKNRGSSIDRSGIQTRRGKLKEPSMPVVPPVKRGRGGRPRNERKANKLESAATPTDVYEFRDEFDEANKEQRPRLILTIKSPAISNSNNSQTTAIVKEVTKDGAKEIGKEQPRDAVSHTAVIKSVENKEDFTSPTTTNTRKSRRLQEKDTSRNTVDDTIEDVVKNTIQTRAAANQRRSARQATPKQPPPPVQPETQRKSPRGRKPRRGSEATENSSSEDTPKEDVKPTSSPPKEHEKPKEADKAIDKQSEPAKDKPHEGLKAVVLRRIKGEINTTSQHEPTNLIDPVTGELIPMRESEEGKYIPLPGSTSDDQRQIITTTSKSQSPAKPLEPVKTQPGVIAQPQQATIIQQPKPHSFKAHVLSSQAAQAIVTQQPPTIQAKTSTAQQPTLQSQSVMVSKPTAQVNVSKSTTPVVVPKSITNVLASKTITPVLVSKSAAPVVVTKSTTPMIVSKSITPISQHLNINTSLGMGVVSSAHISPRSSVPLTVSSKSVPKQLVKPPVLSPVAISHPKQILQVSKQQSQLTKGHMVTPMVTSQAQIVNTQMAHMKQHQPVMKQQVIMGKGPIAKPAHSLHQQQILTGAVASPPLGKSQSPLSNPSRIIQGPTTPGTKGVMDPPKVDVSMANVMLGQRPKLSPQGPQQRLVSQTGIPVPSYEASLGEAIAHFPPGPLRPPPDLNPAHYMHPSHVMQYQQYLRQQQLQHLARSGGMEKVGDGQEGEEAPVTSPPLELRRPGSVGLALTSRGVAVPHSLHSPHDRATDSPQVGQVYNVHSARMQHYHPNRYYDQTEPPVPPPAHRQQTSHSSLAALGSDRGLAHITPMGTPDRPLSSHSALTAHMGGLGTPDRPLSSHVERPLTTHGLMGAGLGAAGNLMGAVARHIGADAPTSQRGLQAATPPHASQVPPQAESLFMLLKQYPCMWQGLLALKNDQAAVQMYFVSGNDDVAKCSLPKNTDGSTPPLRIFQRMRLEPPQVEGVARKMQMENEHCMLLALPCGHDHMDVLKQSTNLTSGFITYLQQKQAAGIVNVAAPGTTQPPAYVVHIFPSCDFVNENLRRIAPSLLERVADIAHLLIVITTV